MGIFGWCVRIYTTFPLYRGVELALEECTIVYSKFWHQTRGQDIIYFIYFIFCSRQKKKKKVIILIGRNSIFLYSNNNFENDFRTLRVISIRDVRSWRMKQDEQGTGFKPGDWSLSGSPIWILPIKKRHPKLFWFFFSRRALIPPREAILQWGRVFLKKF